MNEQKSIKEKKVKFEKLVAKRKEFKFSDPELVNPSQIEGGMYDKENYLNPWDKWHGNLDAKILLIGQDWGSEEYYRNLKGEYDKDVTTNLTNANLRKLFKEIGFDNIDENHDIPLFFTNAVLGMKKGKMDKQVKEKWYLETANEFIKPLINIVNPEIIIAMGEAAYKTIAEIYELRVKPLKEITGKNPINLSDSKKLFVVYHCTPNCYLFRKMDLQKEDWRKIKEYIDQNSISI